jgi:cell wall-associated NlpC family hydrolase
VKVVVLAVSIALMLLLSLPLGLVLVVSALMPPAAAESCTPPRRATGMPQPGSPRRASLTNPPTGVPAAIKALYEAAAATYGLPWTLLAGVGMAETNHGRNATTSSAGAEGLMQFMPATFAAYGVDGNNDGSARITDDADSIYSAANYLAAFGARAGPDGIRRALFTYNHALWYVNDVLYYAASYEGDDLAANFCVTNDTTTTAGPVTGTGSAIDAVRAALKWLGTPYSWGGGDANGPTTGICCSPSGHDDHHIVGFDCSGLVLYAYAQVGIRLPHLAQDISYSSGGQAIPRDFTLMKPGDTIGFSYAPDGSVFHIGIYLGDAKMIDSDSHGVSVATLTSGYYASLAWKVVRFAA